MPPLVNLPQNTNNHTERKSVVTPPSSSILITHSSGTMDCICSSVKPVEASPLHFDLVSDILLYSILKNHLAFCLFHFPIKLLISSESHSSLYLTEVVPCGLTANSLDILNPYTSTLAFFIFFKTPSHSWAHTNLIWKQKWGSILLHYLSCSTFQPTL